MASNTFGRLLAQSYRASTTPDYIERLCTSWLLPPWGLFALRAFLSFYTFLATFVALGWLSSHPYVPHEAEHTFSYFTDLGFWGLAFYFAFAAAHTASYASRGRACLESWPGVLKWLHSLLYTTITVFPYIVTAVFWAVLAAGAFSSQFNTWSNISKHALNAVFAFLEILLSRSNPHPWLLLVPLIVILALYVGLAYLTHATEHFYVYDFLNPRTSGRGIVAAYCVGILAAVIVLFVLVRYAILLRRWITEKKLGLTGKLSRHHRPAGLYSNGDVKEMSTVPKSTV